MVPEDAYSSSYLQEEPLDKSYDFISQCAAHGYHIRWAGLRAGWGQGRGSGQGDGLTTCSSPQPHQLVPVLPRCGHLPLPLL